MPCSCGFILQLLSGQLDLWRVSSPPFFGTLLPILYPLVPYRELELPPFYLQLLSLQAEHFSSPFPGTIAYGSSQYKDDNMDFSSAHLEFLHVQLEWSDGFTIVIAIFVIIHWLWL